MTFLKVDTNDVEAARKRAQLLEPLGDAPRTAAAYQRVVDVDPFDTHAQTHRRPAGAAAKDAAAAIRAFRAALASQPPDRAVGALRSRQAYLLGWPERRTQSARRSQALEIAPSFEPAQDCS